MVMAKGACMERLSAASGFGGLRNFPGLSEKATPVNRPVTNNRANLA
jgi:hypothetical protein